MNHSGTDEYRSWDAAYVLGALVSAERREFEEHLAVCPGCRAAVADLAGLPPLLAALSLDEAQAIGPAGSERPARVLVPALAQRVRRGRRRTRLGVVGLVLGAAAASGALAVAVTAPAPVAVQTQAVPQTVLKFSPVTGSALVAQGTLTGQSWGTRIDWECTYTPSPADIPSPSVPGAPRAQEEYGLVVVDARGVSTQVATWTATPGSAATPTATTAVRIEDIRRVDIVAAGSGRTLLSAPV
jgi:RNA polymerase sigma-70 factor (ECF subfamily)